MTAVRRAAWLADEVLLVVAEAPSGDSGGASDAVVVEGRVHEGPTARLYALASPAAALDSPSITVRDAASPALTAADVLDATTDLGTLLREELAPWPAQARSETLAFLAALPLALGGSPPLTASLRQAREALRERQPLTVGDERGKPGIGITAMCAVDGTGFYVDGWIRDPGAPLLRLTALSPEGERVELAERAARHRRDPAPDDRSGFACFFETRGPTTGSGWTVEMQDAAGRGAEAATVPWVEDPARAREAILAAVGFEAEDHDALLEQHVEPALTRLHTTLRDRVGIAALDVHGQVAEPAVAVVGVLDGPIALLEHQLTLLAGDASLADCELTYVVCRPHDAETARQLAHELHELYGVPLRLLIPTEPVQPALARRLGASVATAPRLLFLDAHVVPGDHGWLPAMVRFHEATPNAGPLSPKLAREDSSIAHAGFRFERGDGDRWTRRGRFEGLHESLPAAGVACAVMAVDAACMLVEADLYRTLDGFSSLYLEGGYDACDLCLRTERASWYLPHATLFEVDAGGHAVEDGELRERYDSWLLGRLRGEALTAAQP